MTNTPKGHRTPRKSELVNNAQFSPIQCLYNIQYLITYIYIYSFHFFIKYIINENYLNVFPRAPQ